MKKISMLMIVLLCLFLMAACGEDATSPSHGGDHTQSPGNVTSVVSVYDTEMNLVGKFSYYSTTENTIDVTQFAKTGYKFEGIYDMSRDIMLFNASGKQVPTVMLDMDFTAVVKYSPMTYQLVFDAGEGELENPAEYTKMISYQEPVSLFPKPVLAGMELDGWFDEAGNRFSDGVTPVASKFTEDGFVLSGDVIKLYARYTVKYCDVRLMLQDGSPDIKLQVAYGQKLPDLTEYLKDDGNRAIMGFGVSPSSSVAFTDAVYTDLDLYALWREYKYVNFVYSPTETKIVKVWRENNMAVLPDGVWPGYEFEGWYASSLLSGNKIQTIPFTGMADTYYGKWSVGSYTIQFVADGSLVGSCTYSINNMDITVPQVPVKQNYTGKWEDYSLEFKDAVVQAIYTPEERNVTLLNGAEYTYHTITYGEMYQLRVPTKVGHNFTGWYYKGEKLTDAQGNSLAPYTFDTAITMTAGWEPKICTLYFETNGGNVLESVKVKYGELYVLSQIPQRSGFHFDGWYDESMTNLHVGTIVLTEDTVVYAKWVKSTAISTVDELKKIAENPAGNYHLVNDIDLKGGDWAPIENFSGILDGNGYKIHNFSLRQSGVSLGFVITNSGSIKNITFSNVDVSNTLNGAVNCAIGVVSAYNTGSIVNVTVEKMSALVNLSATHASTVVKVGILTGQNSGQITHGSVQGELMFKTDIRSGGYGGDSYSGELFIGGAVGKDDGTIAYIHVDVFVDANEYVYSTSNLYENYQTVYLHIGGISGGEYGAVSECAAKLTCQLQSDAGGNAETRRYTRIGGIVGCCYENSTVTNCYSNGSIAFKRLGRLANYEMATGGIAGTVDSGTVDNCTSAVNITLQQGHGGTTGGIVGLLGVNGKVSNVAYYGQIKTDSFTDGYFGGLVGKVNGWLTKGYFHGQIISTSTKIADIAGLIDTSGSVSKTIGNGGTGKVFASSSGSSIYNYLIGTDYDETLLYSREILFDTLGLFEADYWSINEETGLYLIAFPEYSLEGA